jgi:HEPN domain-containing protein
LGASVYFYAIGLVGEKAIFEMANKIGHVTYALALIAPPLFFLLYPVSLAASIVVKFTQSPAFSKIIEYALSAFIGVAASLISNSIFQTFSQRDKTEKVEKLADQENQLLARAKGLFKQDYFDLAVTESWKAVEISLNKTFISIGEKRYPKTMRSLLELAIQRNILKESQADELKMILRIRNEAVHTERHIDQEEASNALNLSEKIIASLEGASDSCYFCNRTFHIKDLETDDLIGVSVCKDCAKKNPNWKDELMAMGMDP